MGWFLRSNDRLLPTGALLPGPRWGFGGSLCTLPNFEQSLQVNIIEFSILVLTGFPITFFPHISHLMLIPLVLIGNLYSLIGIYLNTSILKYY